MTALGDLDRARIGELYAQELARFRADRPRSLAMISRARAHMPNGVPMARMASDYEHTSTLGGEMADGIEAAIRLAGLPWTVIRLGPRSGQWYGPMPRTGCRRMRSPMASSPA